MKKILLLLLAGALSAAAQTNLKISALPASTAPVADPDLFVVNQSSFTYKVPASALKTYALTFAQPVNSNLTALSTGSPLTAGTGIAISGTWPNLTLSTTSAGPTGAAGGDLGGTYPNPTVTNASHLTNFPSATVMGLGSASTNAASAFAPASGSANYDAAGAATAAQAYAIQRANQTGTQAASTITGLSAGATNAAAYQAPITLTTTGTSGAATFASGTLNVPQYSGATYTAGAGLSLNTGAFSVNYGTTSGTAAQGNDSRLTGAAQKSANLGDLQNIGTASTVLGLPRVIGPASHTFVNIGDSITEGPQGQPTYAAQSYTAVEQSLGLGTGGSLFYNHGLKQETTAHMQGQYYGKYNTTNAETTSTFSSGSSTITVTSAANMAVGMSIMAQGLQLQTTITSVSGTTIGISLPTLAAGSGVATSAAIPVVNIYYGELYAGGAANGWTGSVNTSHQLSKAITGIASDVFILAGANDFLENTGATTTLVATTTSGSPNLTVTSASGTYTGLVYGLVLTGTGLPASPLPPYIISGQGTASLVLSANATASGSVTLTVHYPVTALATWQSQLTTLIGYAHADQSIVTVGTLLPAGNNPGQGSPVSEVFRGEFNTYIVSKASGQDYNIDTASQMPAQTAVVTGNLYYHTDLLHLSYFGSAVVGQYLNNQYFSNQPALTQGPWAPPGVGTDLPGSNTIWVSGKYGDDGKPIAQKYSFLNPYKSLSTAMAVATSSNTDVTTGTFSSGSNTVTVANTLGMAVGNSIFATGGGIPAGAVITAITTFNSSSSTTITIYPATTAAAGTAVAVTTSSPGTGDSVYVLDGLMTDSNIQLKNGVNIYLASGAEWKSGGTNTRLLYDNSSPSVSTVFGHGQTITWSAAFNNGVELGGSGSSISFRGITLDLEPNGGHALHLGGPNETVYVGGDLIDGATSAGIYVGGAGGTATITGSLKGGTNNGLISLYNSATIKVGGDLIYTGSSGSGNPDAIFQVGGTSTVTVGGTINGGAGNGLQYNSGGTVTVTAANYIEGTGAVSNLSNFLLTLTQPIPTITALTNPSTTSFTQAFSGNADQLVNLTQTGGTMAAGTFTLPGNTASHVLQSCEIANNSASAITALSVTAPSGTVYGVPSTLSAGQRLTIKKIASNVWSAK